MNPQIQMNFWNSGTEGAVPPANRRSWLEKAAWISNVLTFFMGLYNICASGVSLHPSQHPLLAITTPVYPGNPMTILINFVMGLALIMSSIITGFYAFRKKTDAPKSREELNAQLQAHQRNRLPEQEAERWRSRVDKLSNKIDDLRLQIQVKDETAKVRDERIISEFEKLRDKVEELKAQLQQANERDRLTEQESRKLKNELDDLRRTQMKDEVDRLRNETRNELESLGDEVARLRNSIALISQPQPIESVIPRKRPSKVNRSRIKRTGTHDCPKGIDLN